jgi:hypothetical protein
MNIKKLLKRSNMAVNKMRPAGDSKIVIGIDVIADIDGGE